MQLVEHASELHYYVPPLVVTEQPAGMSTAEYVAKLEAGEGSVVDTTRLLSREVATFLDSATADDRVLAVLGEAGAGKSLFTWLTVKRLLAEWAPWMAGGGGVAVDGTASPPGVLWVPIVFELKHYKASELAGLLPRRLKSVLGLTDSAVNDLVFSRARLPWLPGVCVRLLVLCDGYDELLGEDDAGDGLPRRRATTGSIVTTLCGGPAVGVDPRALKVVVTCRESRFQGRFDEAAVLGKHRRAVLLPFNKAQVCVWFAPWQKSVCVVAALSRRCLIGWWTDSVVP